jgi:hypothetical protein
VLDTGDTAWMIVSTALVMMMTPAGLALFYGGMSRYKNLLNTLAMTFVSYCLASVIWMMWGYTLAFGTSQGGIIGGFDHFFMAGIGVDSLSGSIPTYVFALFQMTFAGITVALVLGSMVDRMKFSSWIVSPSCGSPSSTAPSPTGYGAAAGWERWGPLTLPAATWCISMPVWRAWCYRWCWASASATAKRPCFPPASP